MDNNNYNEYSYPENEAPAPETPAAPAQIEKSVSTAVFFGLEILISIPLIGLIASIIFSFAPKNENLKHYARAKMIRCIISLILSILLIIGCIFVVQTVTTEVQKKIDEFSASLEEFSFIEELFGQIDGVEDIANLIGQLGEIEDVSDIVEMFGGAEALGDIMQDFSAEKMDQVAELLQDPAVIEEIVEEVRELDGIEEAIENIGGVDRLTEVDDINELLRMVGDIKDTETKQTIINIIRDRTN